MRGLTYLAACVLLLMVTCQQKTDSPPTSQDAKAPAQLLDKESKPESSLVVEYEQFLTKLDSGDVASMTKAADKYASLFKGQPTSVADSGYVLFEEFYQRTNDKLNEVHYRDTSDYFMPLVSDTEEPIPKKLQEYSNLMNTNGFSVDYQEGGTYLKQNRTFITRHFYPFVSPIMKEYLVQVEEENEDGFNTDGGIFITETEFVNRILWWENFMKENPSFVMRGQGKKKLKEYLTYFLEGMDNTPIMDMADSTKINQYYASAYTRLNKLAPTSEANKLVKPYFQELKKGDKTTAQKLLAQYRRKELIFTWSKEGCPY
ncbi:hypothetical protein [Rufibacter hautae]|uniref:Uncharacterized protein n=1 Tax=Rufibacter hautae TaxID=2595005 RepID=A0A5B6TIM4_9BACT|nr:hypothetical protein [Rufibacter hautae]KAA3440514.1 hypothetical protein FOA19_07645 [Rufibacter hautae]